MQKAAVKKILFSAPHHFLDKSLFPESYEIVYKEVWHQGQLDSSEEIVGWITNTGWSFVLDSDICKLFPNLKAVVTPSTGKDHINVSSLENSGIKFFSLLDDKKNLDEISSSSEFTFLLLLSSLRRLSYATKCVENGIWRRDSEDTLRGHELYGRKIGIIGYGRNGKKVARYLKPFNASFFYYDPYEKSDVEFKVDSLESLFLNCNSIVICCTESEETYQMINLDLLELLQPNSTLVNTSRGSIIDEQGLAAFLKKRSDVVVALDVLNGEAKNLQFNSPILEHLDQNKVIVTPHIGGASYESQNKAALISLNLLNKYLTSSI